MTRYRFSFWLDDTHETDHQVAAVITDLKRGRGFSSAIRDGLRLIADLRAGRVEWLLYLFPWVKDYFQPPVQDSSALQRQLDELKALLMERGKNPQPVTGPQPLTVPKLALPQFDDDDDQEPLAIRKDISTNAAENFLRSMMALQQ